MKKLSFFPLIIVFLVSGNVSAFDHEITHRQLTEKAIENSLANQYLIDNLNLSDGTATLINGVKIEKWLIEGSYLEDEPNCRASNHFHNPLKPWTDSYMSDQPWFINWWCSDGEYPAQNIKSNIHWATGYTEPAPDGTKAETNNQWDWDHAREYFYIYLTGRDFQENEVAGTEDIKKTYFVNCFQALGQVLHLIQDMAVPAHVRDDFKSHLDFQGITPANLFKPKKWFRDKIEYYVEHHIKELLMGSVGGELTEPSLTKFWDTNDYIGQDPDDLNNLMIGLAEYTNMNFASKNTIFAEDFLSDSNTSNDDYYHPYPRKTSTDVQDYINRNKLPETVIGEDNIPDIRFHIKKTGDGEEIAYFAAPTYLTRDIQNEPDYDERVFNRSFKIDDKCAKNYAELLLPRAVGYSAGLLDYFFRGTIEITNPLIWSNINANSGLDPADSNHITLFARNTAPDGEDMSVGTFQVVVKYRLSEQDPFQYIVKEEVNNTSSIPSDTAQELEFDLSDNLVPSDAVDLSLYLVYKGKLGQEDEAVGVGFQQPFNNIKISLPDSGVYALTDLGPDVVDPSQQGFDRIQILAQNTAPEGEEMTGGTVTLVVKYKLGEGDQFQNPPAATSDEFHYIVKELEGTHSISRITPVLFEFDINASQIPLWATDVYLNLVYKGNLGSEVGAIAVGSKDISEPTPINYYNVMDKICMTTSTGPQLFDSGSTAAIDYVDVDNNGIADPDEWDVYPHNAANIHIRFSPEDNPQAATSASSADNNYEKAILNLNDYFRLFILSDHRFNRSASVEYVKITAEDQCDQFHGTFPRPPTAMDGIKNQTDLVDPVNCGYEPCYARLIPGFHTTRGVVSFFSVLFDNASNPIDSICSYED